jgi:predicted lipoprotein with Yx(FWY)xxD motif
MRKSRWAVAVGLGSLVLLLAACGGSSSGGSSGSNPTGAGQATGALGLAPGDIVLIAQNSKIGFVLAEAGGQVVYRYAHDTKGGMPTCTGACAAVWLPVTGVPKVSVADTLPGVLGTVTLANGAKQVTYNGYPLYTLKGAMIMSTKGNGIEGLWHVIKLSKKDVKLAS